MDHSTDLVSRLTLKRDNNPPETQVIYLVETERILTKL